MYRQTPDQHTLAMLLVHADNETVKTQTYKLLLTLVFLSMARLLQMSGHCVLSLEIASSLSTISCRRTSFHINSLQSAQLRLRVVPGEKKASDSCAKCTILNVFVCENEGSAFV